MTRLIAVVLSIVVVTLAGAVTAGAAEDSSDWVANQYTSSRLFVGSYDAGRQVIHMGWHVKLRDGWKTYWRTPGEAGMPPAWQWNNVGPLKEIKVLWPAPERITAFGYESNIYHDEIILPIDVFLTGGGGPVKLSLAVNYMICKDVCIPLEASYSMDIRDPSTLDVPPYTAAMLQKYRALVPLDADPEFLVVRNTGEGSLEVSLQNPRKSSGKNPYRDLFIEGPDGYYFSSPIRETNGNGILFTIPYTRDRMQDSLDGREITLTLVPHSGQALEVRARVAGK